jgi:hypothetical protein
MVRNSICGEIGAVIGIGSDEELLLESVLVLKPVPSSVYQCWCCS